MSLPSVEGYIEADAVKGMRIVLDGDTPKAEYLIKWKDGSEDTWELASNLSDDLVRDYEEKWWAAARKAEFDVMAEMLKGGREALSAVVDENRRSALHFAAALGKPACVKLLAEAGADVNLQDKEGYTPLHMAAGYMHTAAMTALLELGADPQIKDNTGKDVVSLIENIRGNMPLSLGTVMQRMRLEEVCNSLTDMLYEEVPPGAIMEERRGSDGKREFLVAFTDGREDAWVHERDVSAAVLEDYEAGLEYAEAVAIVDMVQVGTERKFKIQWSDNYPVSWEPEEHVPSDLIALFEQQNPQLFQERVASANEASAVMPDNDYSVQWADTNVRAQVDQANTTHVNVVTIPQHAAGSSNGSSSNGTGKGEEVMAGAL